MTTADVHPRSILPRWIVGIVFVLVLLTAWPPAGLLAAGLLLAVTLRSAERPAWLLPLAAVLFTVAVVTTGGYLLALTGSPVTGTPTLPSAPH